MCFNKTTAKFFFRLDFALIEKLILFYRPLKIFLNRFINKSALKVAANKIISMQ